MGVLGTVQASIQMERLLNPGERVVVGVSGGADSLCLLDCLARLRYEVVVGHLDHGLRPASAKEAERVGEIAAQMGLAFEARRVELGARHEGGSLEEAGRLARYRFLIEVARAHGAGKIATGHTADDQAETVLMHLLRGAGTSGLRGMLPSTSLDEWVGFESGSELRLVRPLLRVSRAETERYCEARGIEWSRDESNLDPKFLRNRLRHELLPMLETYNPRIREILNRTAQVMAAEADAMREWVSAAWGRTIRKAGEHALGIDKAGFRELPLAVQRGLLRQAVFRLKPELRDAGFPAVERIRSVLSDENTRRISAVGGLEAIDLGREVALRLEGADISFPEFPQLIGEGEHTLPVPGTLALRSGLSLAAVRSPVTADSRPGLTAEREGKIALDAAGLPNVLVVRPPRTGDRIRTLGMKGHIKVSDLLVNRHIPWPARAHWPLVTAGEQVIWVAGLRMSHDHRLVEESQEAVVLSLERQPGRAAA